MFWGFSRISWKSGSRLRNPVLGSDVEQCEKITLKHPENTNKTCFEAFWEILEKKPPWNTWKTPTKHVLRLFKNFLKIWFWAPKSCSRLRCRTMRKKIHWNTQKTPTKHVLRLFEKFLKIRFSAQKCGSQHRFRTMRKNTLKHSENTNWTCFEAFKEIYENPVLGSNIRFSAQMSNNAKNTLKLRKHKLNMFWGFLRIFWKSGSRLKNPVLGPDVEEY